MLKTASSPSRRTPWPWILLALVSSSAAPAMTRPPKEEPPVEVEPATTTTTATGDSVDDFGDCHDDILKFCPGFWNASEHFKTVAECAAYAEPLGYSTGSCKYGLTSCLAAHDPTVHPTLPASESITTLCGDSQHRRAAINVDYQTSCTVEMQTWCKGVKPKPGPDAPQVTCLLSALAEHTAEFRVGCCEPLWDHESAKPAGTGKFPTGITCAMTKQ